MASIAFPELWIGPAGSGKLTAARKALGVPAGQQPRLLTLEIGDYSARYWEFPSHMEVDIMDLSMMDKQILPELLTQLLSTRDVTGGRRKVMILRHVHGLSPAAATRLRVCLEELVWSPGAPAMIWCTARVLNSVVSHIADGFVYRRVPGTKRLDREGVAVASGGAGTLPVATIQTYIAEMLRQMVCALNEGPRCLGAATWIRGRVYDLLGLMITGSDLVAGLTWGTVRLAAAGAIKPKQSALALEALTRARWVPSYRTPLMLELIVVSVYDALAAGNL